jgi:hypothetical protein
MAIREAIQFWGSWISSFVLPREFKNAKLHRELSPGLAGFLAYQTVEIAPQAAYGLRKPDLFECEIL